MFKQGAYCTFWGFTIDNGRVNVEMSSSRKNKNTGEYETDFSSKFVRFFNKAGDDVQDLQKGDRIKLGECGVTTYYNKDTGKNYTNFMVFDFEKVERSASKGSNSVDDDDDVPM